MPNHDSFERVQTIVIREQPSNPLGVAAFVLALVSFVSLGFLAPLALILSIVAMTKKPKDMAVAGLVLSLVGCFLALVTAVVFGVPMLAFAYALANVDKSNDNFKAPPPEVAAVAPLDYPAPVNTEPVKPPPAPLTATLSNVERINSPSGGAMISMQIRNTSKVPISLVDMEVSARDRAGNQLAREKVKGRVNPPIKPNETRIAQLPLPRKSPMANSFPSGAKISAELLSAQ